VDVNFPFPSGGSKPHIVVSNDTLQEDDGLMYFLLISSKSYHTQYCFPLKNKMTNITFSKPSYVLCHLIAGYVERDVIRRIGRVKQTFL
jgi:mRNA-degrading endonuclease toxin of MazEF toxin-antitoxin module